MKIFMYDEVEAKNNKCDYKLPPVVWFVIYLVILICFLFFNLFSFIFISSSVISLLLWIVFAIYSIVGMIVFIKQLKRKHWSKQIAFIKENDTFWAVKLVNMNVAYFARVTNPISTAISLSFAVGSAINQQKQNKIMEERKKEANNYIWALEEAKKEEKDIYKDIDKNFELIFNVQDDWFCGIDIRNIYYQ